MYFDIPSRQTFLLRILHIYKNITNTIKSFCKYITRTRIKIVK